MRSIIAGWSVPAAALTLLTAAPAAAAERTVTFAVENMSCAACPYIVRETMRAVDGVDRVEVSYRERRAIVTFDDARASVATIATASTRAGYPATPVPGS